jgi:hypothetical protein
MKTKISTLAIGLFAMAIPMMAAPAQLSQIFPELNVTYAEVFDAGQSISGGSYQVPTGGGGNPLTQISGSILNTSDADIFQIAIASPAAFSATTVNALTTGNGIDTVLWLFNSSGVGVIANDDAPGNTLQSTLSAFIGSGGVFYLAISLSGNEPVNFANQLMFASNGGDPTAVRGPAGGVPGSQSGFDPSGVGFGAFTGNYQIDLLGASVVPEPSVVATFILGSLVSGAVFFARRRRAGRALLVLAAFGVFATSSLFATDIPKNLGYGLDKLVESNLILKGQGGDKGKKKSSLVGDFNGYATQEAANYAAMAIMAKDGRVKVDITLSGKVALEELRGSLQTKFASLEITAVDATYRDIGIIEGWLSVDDAAALSQVVGVRAVFLALKPQTNGGLKSGASVEGGYEALIGPSLNFAMVGTKFLQGVTQHRVDKINQFYNASAPVNYNGNGITVGVLSDSFGSNVGATATNVSNFDLPGAAGNPNNTVPVVVLQDVAGSDEGRGMCEIVYKMAPKAKVGFATAFTGEVEFANNIRALSGQFPAVPHTQVGFAATVICDDVSYGGEPIFADGGVIGNGIDDVAAVGVTYFSSAANSFGVSCYNSDLRMVAYTGGTTSADCPALVGTNVSLAGVPTNLYQGGFHNFNPATGQQDVACLWNIGTAAGIATEVQWDDPYDTSDPVVNQPPIYTNTGFINSATPVNFTDIPVFTAGQEYVITETATSGNFDGIVSVIDPNGVTIVNQDTGTDEVVTLFAPISGQYSISVARFSTTTGNFDLKIFTANGTPLLTTDLNLLVFRADTGAYIGSSSLTANNIASNRPVELGTVVRPAGQTQVQFVIARASVPTAPRPATRVRCGTAANSNPNNAPAEFFDYNSAVTDGHSIVAGCNGSAAYDVFRPNVQQSFTSGGPALVYFNRNQTLKANAPEIRLQPRIAAANGSNSTWTGGDSANDIDTGGGQFFGTSAASPHAAGVAALVQQAHGGPTSVTPTQMTSILQSTAFPHDLDPYTAIGTARATNGGRVTVTIRSDNTAPAGQNRGRLDANSHTIAYTGPSTISTFKFNPNGLISQGGAVTSGQNGVDASNNYFSTVTPGMYFAIATAAGAEPFALGSGTVGLLLTDVVPVLTNPAPAPANPANGQTLTLTFTTGSFAGGEMLRFKIGRGIIRGPSVAVGGASLANYNADLFGGGVLIPENITIPDGMRFSGTLADGATFEGIMKNRLGNGYSQLDGFGFLNAEAAVSAPLP